MMIARRRCISSDGSGFTDLYSFTNGADGANPEAALLLSGNTLYGTAYRGVAFVCSQHRRAARSRDIESFVTMPIAQLTKRIA